MAVKVSELTTRTPVATDHVIVESAQYGTSKTNINDVTKVALNARVGGDLGLKFSGADNAAIHNCYYRGKDLTNVYTINEISARIQDGSFEDLYIGDYVRKTITVEGETDEGVIASKTVSVRFAIADFNYFKGLGGTECKTNHAVMVPMDYIHSGRMNETHTTVGGYAGSRMFTFWMPKYAAVLKSAFGSSHVLNHRCYLSSTVSTTTPSMGGCGWQGAATGGAWTSVDCSLMNEAMVYGSRSVSSSWVDIAERKNQLALFRFVPGAAPARSYFWLSAVADSSSFAFYGHDGVVGYSGAGTARAVRPYFLLA